MTKQIKIGKRFLIVITWSRFTEAYGIVTRKLKVAITQLPPNKVFDDNNEIITIYYE